MFIFRWRPFSFVIATILLTAAPGFAGSVQVDRDSLRREADQTVLSIEDRKQIFAGLRTLILDETAKPDDRCADFYRGVTVFQRVDPTGTVKFAEEMRAQAWPKAASPEKHGLFMCAVAIAYLADRQNDRALKTLKEITQAERASSPLVEAIRADTLLLAAAASGKYEDATEARNSLLAAIGNSRLGPKMRCEYLIDVLRYLFDEGAPPVLLQNVVLQGERLLPSVKGETADRLGVFLDLIKSQLDFGAPWPSDTKEADARILRLADVADKIRNRLDEFKVKYGPSDPATVIAANALATIDLELAPYAEEEAPLEQEALDLCNFLIEQASSIMIEKERVWFVKGIAAGMLGQYPVARQAYDEVKKIHEAAGVDSHIGFRFSRRLLMLALFGDKEPEFVAREWSQGVEAFATHVRTLASKDPDLALSSLDAWNPLPTYGSMARNGRAQTFLDGYIQATGIVKNVPYRRKGVDLADRGRLYGKVGLADVQKKLTSDRPMLVYVLFKDPLPPSRTYYGGFLLNGGDVKYADLGDAKAINVAVAKWKASMRAPTEGGSGDPKVTGKGVYDLLVRPLIPGKLPSGLFIVPDQGLEQVSFAALQTADRKWVVQDCAVDYLGAMRDVTRSTEATKGQPSMLVQGDVYRDHVRLGPATLSQKALRLADPGALFKNASPEALLALRSPRYLHLSVHGDNRPTDQALDFADASWLVLPGPTGSKKDSTFTARQIARLRLDDTRCVLLAACSAAKGKVLSGEGPGGLRRAFYIAGAHAVISSLLWVPETPASLAERRANRLGEAPGDRLLSKVYISLAKGTWPAEALRAAQLQMLASPDTASPLYWAGFICEGN